MLSESTSSSRSLGDSLEVAWLVYFLTRSYTVFDDYLPLPSFYLVVGTFLMFFALARPLQMAEVAAKPIFWLWSLTMLAPMATYYLGGPPNPFAWSSVVQRTTIFAAFAGSAVLLSGPGGFDTLRKAARISLAIAIVFNFADLVFENPYNRSEATGRSSGLYADANMSAAAIGSLLLLSVDITKQNLKGMLVVGLSVLAIISTQSRSGMLFAALLLAAYLFLPRGPGTLPVGSRLAIGLAGLALMAMTLVAAPLLFDIDTSGSWRLRSLVTFDFADGSSQGRLWRAERAFTHFLEHFWTGRGLGSTRFYGIFSHNAYLEVAVEYGIGGLLLFLFVIGNAFYKCLRFGVMNSLTPFLLTFQIAFFSVFSHTVPQSPVYAVIFAAIFAGTLFRSPPLSDRFPTPGIAA